MHYLVIVSIALSLMAQLAQSQTEKSETEEFDYYDYYKYDNQDDECDKLECDYDNLKIANELKKTFGVEVKTCCSDHHYSFISQCDVRNFYKLSCYMK